jgi:hypothetical protein
MIRVGWPQSKKDLPDHLKEYWNHKLELSETQGISLKDQRILIPLVLRRKILDKLHQGHQGIEKTKQRVRQSVFWPQVNKDIEELVSKCSHCQELRNANPKEPLISHAIPLYPWQVVGTDIFHWQDKDYLLVVDYYSRYWEVVRLRSMKAEYVIAELRKIFSRYGIPEKMSYNGPQYASREFQEFAKTWEFKHVTSSPRYPRSNGLAEKNGTDGKEVVIEGFKQSSRSIPGHSGKPKYPSGRVRNSSSTTNESKFEINDSRITYPFYAQNCGCTRISR